MILTRYQQTTRQLMKMIGTVVLFLASAGVLCAQPQAAPISTDASAFVHQLKLKNGTEEVRYRQVVSPVTFSVPVALGSVNIQSAYMYIEARDSVTSDVSGPMDTQITGEWGFGNILFTGYVNAPTGMDSLETSEATLTRDISRNDLNFPIKTFGQGLDWGGALTLAHQVGQWALSVGGGYIVRGPYAPLATVSDYDPGDELTVTAGASYATGGWTLGLDASGKMIRVDRLTGTPVFRNGKQFVGKGSVTYESRMVRLDATLTEIARLKNRAMSTDGALLYEDRDSNGNDLRAFGRLSLRPVTGVTVFGEAHYKDITENAYDPTDALFQGAARLWSYGGGVSIKIGSSEALTLRLIRGEGWINDQSEDVETLNARVSFRLFF
jgi:hypothetical protein